MNLNRIIIDANVVVKWFIEEKDSNYALILRDKFINGEIELWAPPLLKFEVLNALKYSKLFNQEELNEVGVSLENYGIIIDAINGDVRKKMVDIALRHDLSIYDAAYVGLALHSKGILFTADEKIIKKLPKAMKSSVYPLTQVEEVVK